MTSWSTAPTPPTWHADFPTPSLKIYPNSGHGGVFQHHQTFVPDALQFLAN